MAVSASGLGSVLLENPAQAIPDTFRQAQPNLLPRVRERSYHGITQLQLQVEGLDYAEAAHRVLPEHLLVELSVPKYRLGGK